MDRQSADLHHSTPILAVVDPRGLAVRSVAWYRRQIADTPVARIHRSVFDPAGRPTSNQDPRLGEDGWPANLATIHSLSAQLLARDSVDAGWRVFLPGESQEFRQGWDGRNTVRRIEYDALLRPAAVFENEQCAERLTYGDVDSAAHNQCGQLIRHDDPAGTRLNTEFSLTGAVIEQTQHFTQSLARPDWPEPEAGRDALLEPGTGATSRWRFNPLGDPLEQTDAQGNVQRFTYTIAGRLHACFLQLAGQAEQSLVSDIRYDAQGRVETETAGNGVLNTAGYGEEDGRLLALKAVRSNGEPLQDLGYEYDPVGNVIRIEDLAQPTRHFANQRIEPVSTYQYDTLYQLSEATGRELAAVNHGPVFPDFQSPPDPTQLANYTQTYHYDAGGNLQQLTHVGSQNHSRTLVTARQSNHSLLVENDQPPTEEDIAAAFDANGNLLHLYAGQTLNWDLRNQLHEVRPVVRESGEDDSERYVYDASGQRLRKVRSTQAHAVTHSAEVRYLPGLELRTNTATGEVLQVITAQAGRGNVHVLHWQAGKPTELPNDQYRYSLTDHLNSSTLELDKDAAIISQESYYPFGGASWWAGRSVVEASYKTVRYSGKERDATGLYYYGLRYYAPWLQHWINPDPAEEEGGLNLFCFVRNSPMRFIDAKGAAPYDVLDKQEMDMLVPFGLKITARGLQEFNAEQASIFKSVARLADRLLEGVLNELPKVTPRQGVARMISAFGDMDASYKQQLIEGLINSFTRQRAFIGSLLTDAQWKISLFASDAAIAGRTSYLTESAPMRTISLNANFLNRHPLEVAWTLIHEASHAADNTVDYYYFPVNQLPSCVTDEALKQWSAHYRAMFADIRKYGPDPTIITDRYWPAMSFVAGHPITPENAAQAFQDPAVGLPILLRNADTYSSFVMGTKLPVRLMAKQNARAARRSGYDPAKEVF
ncbi:RHS repeat domain-containing protein [Pseudomonas capsici]|uniref:RHS repeat domain-containing protein n=1 Tax=Pseudomonas capsici TaxID=2810614 RepID=UPI0021F0E396|nr:RHS repeat-associated core domain-containing protein [Pseudomonas capsici]MCV4282897.1 RHS repeat protein [Pseudomonas capsici]